MNQAHEAVDWRLVVHGGLVDRGAGESTTCHFHSSGSTGAAHGAAVRRRMVVTAQEQEVGDKGSRAERPDDLGRLQREGTQAARRNR
jgi:hypothetical protein